MGLVLTIVAVAMILGLGLLGWRRGVARGLLGLVGTLLGAVLVDLWGKPWADWLQALFRPENAALLTWWAVTLLFVSVALLIGYGSSSLLVSRPDPKRVPAISMRERGIGTLIGALNGALLASYPLHYITVVAPGSDLAVVLNEHPLLGLLHDWLPWFVLALVAATAVLVILRGGIRLVQALSARPAAAPSQPAARPASSSVAAASSQPEKLQAVSQKIDEALNKKN